MEDWGGAVGDTAAAVDVEEAVEVVLVVALGGEFDDAVAVGGFGGVGVGGDVVAGNIKRKLVGAGDDVGGEVEGGR